MKKFILVPFLILGVLHNAWADEASDEIKARFNAAFAAARDVCVGLSGSLDSLKVLAGVGVAAGAAGTVSGGVALGTGIAKNFTDKDIQKLEDDLKKQLTFAPKTPVDPTADLSTLDALTNYITKTMPNIEKLSTMRDDSQTLGNVRTYTAFGAGATGAVGAATSFAGIKGFDDLIENMNACDTRVKEIERQKMEMTFAAPDDPDIARMDNIVKNCGGLNPKNIADVKNKLMTAGIVSAVGAAAGVVGGITSAVAVSKEKVTETNKAPENQKALNLTATISSGVAAAGNLGGAILSGVTLSGLIKNGDIAKACAGAFN